MNGIETLGRDIRALALDMLDDAEAALKEIGIYNYAYDRTACKIVVFSGTPRDRHLLFSIHAFPFSGQLAVYYLRGRCRKQAPDSAQDMESGTAFPEMPERVPKFTEYVPVYRFRWRKPCRRHLSMALRKLQSHSPTL